MTCTIRKSLLVSWHYCLWYLPSYTAQAFRVSWLPVVKEASFSHPRTLWYSFPFASSTLCIMHFVYPKTFCISIVFNFSWDDCKSQEKLKTMLMQKKFGGVNKVHYGRCGSGEFKKRLSKWRWKNPWIRPQKKFHHGAFWCVKHDFVWTTVSDCQTTSADCWK